ncbi:MAG: hypothetical protein JWM32_1449 [Verrucomicrobia bacterium]|nr:hypothetical protein [Verrucomicrobiota bacterium]
MSSSTTSLLPALAAWFESEAAVTAAVLYGSSARTEGMASADRWSDLDLHVITTDSARIEGVDWARALPGRGFCHRAERAAAGGVPKVRLLFADGEVEMVLMPAARLRVARVALSLGLHRRVGPLRDGLNVLATGVSSGYRFLKGEKAWGGFYRRVASEMAGIRMTDAELRGAADLFVCDLLSSLQRIERGELAAAQRALHRVLAETNFVLVRELRLRRKLPVPSFEPARRVESLLSPEELEWVRISARLDRDELRRAAWHAFAGMQMLMSQLVPAWRLEKGVFELLQPYAGGATSP